MKNPRMIFLMVFALLLTGALGACAPEGGKVDNHSHSSSIYELSSQPADWGESSPPLVSTPLEDIPSDGCLFPEAQALTHHLVSLVFTQDHIENAQPLRDGDIFRFMLSFLVQSENQLTDFYPDCLSVSEDGQAVFPLEQVRQMVSDVFGQSDWFFEDSSYDAQQNAYCMAIGFGLHSVYSYEDLNLAWNAEEQTVTADFSLIDTPAFPGEKNYGTYRITYRAVTEEDRTFLRYESVQKVRD